MKKFVELLKDNKTGPLIFIGIFALFLLLISAIPIIISINQNKNIEPTNNTSKIEEDFYGHDRFDAIVVANTIVKNNLKAPSSAKFCGNSDYTVSCTENTWTVKGYVDAQNSFGANLRNNFTVEFTFISTDKYTTDSCKFN